MRVAALAAGPELKWIRETMAALTIRRGWDDCELSGTSQLQEWLGWLSGGSCAEVIICDAGVHGALAGLKALRPRNEAALVVPIAGDGIPPAEYVHPDVRPVALLWNPLAGAGNREMLQRVLAQAYSAAEDPARQRFTMRGRRESRQIPYGEIFYFEAREKKVFVHLREQEIGVSETISALEEQLPERFIRCHKGFLVNRDHVESVDWPNQIIRLEHGLAVPLSRGCRAAVKEKLYGIE